MDTLADYSAWKAKQQQSNVAAATTILDTAEGQPDQVAGDLNLANDYGKTTGNPVPPLSMVSEYRPLFQQAIEREKNKTILSSSPRLTEWLRNPENAVVGRDDLGNLSWWEIPLNNAKNAGARGVMRLPQSYNQFLAIEAARRNQDQQRSFGEILSDQRGTIEVQKDGQWQSIPQAAGPSDFPLAVLRYGMSRLSGFFGIDEKQAATYYQQQAGQIAKRIEQVPMSEAGSRFREKLKSDVYESGDSWQQLHQFMTDVRGDVGGFLAFLSETAAESAPSLAAAAAVGAATRSPTAAAVTLGGSSFIQEYGTSPVEFFQEKGIDVSTPEGALKAVTDPKLMREAAQRGLLRGLIVGAMDGLSGGVAGKQLAESPLGNMVLQAITQSGMGAAGEAGGQVASGQDFNLRDVLLEGLAEFVTAPVEVAGMGREYLRDARKARSAEDRKALFTELSGQAQSSALRNRMPDKFRQFVEAATANGPVENLYVPADQFVQYFQSVGVDPHTLVDELEGVTRDDLDVALAAGGDLQIPTATYAAKIAGSEHDAFLMENMRFDPDEFTAREAQEFNARAQDAMEEAWAVAEQVRQDHEQLRSYEQEIYDTMVTRLREAGRSTDVATTEALLYPAFYRVMAERSNMTIEEFAQAYPLPKVQGDIPEGMQFRDVDGLTRTLAEARARRSAGLDKGRSLLEFISEYGGINDPGGELKARDAEVIKRGRGKKSLKLARGGVMAGIRDMFGGGEGGKKHGVDDVARAAIEAGYMADDPDVHAYQAAIAEGRETPDITGALWGAIDRELAGEAQHATGGAARSDAADLDQIEAYLESLGVSLDDDDAAIRKAVQEDQEAGRQYAQASNKGRETPTGPDGRTMLFDRMAQDWRNHAKRIIDGTATREMEVLRESPVLAEIVGGRGKVSLDSTVAGGVRSKHPDIPARVWAELPTLLADPAFAFVRKDGRVAVVLDAVTASGSPIIVGVGEDQIRTITPWDDREGEPRLSRLAHAIDEALGRKGKLYIKSEAALAEVPIRTGTNLPGMPAVASEAGLSRQGQRAKIVTRADVVKAKGRIFYQDEASADEIAAENIVSEYARGEISPGEARKKIRAMGWNVGPDGFRKKHDSVELIAPDGRSVRTYGQSGPLSGTRGSVQFPAAGVGNGDTVIRLFQSANLSTMLHESGHYFLTVMQDLAGKGEASAMDDFAAVQAWWRENAGDVARDGMRAMPDVKLTAEDVIAALDQGTTGDVMKDAAIDVGMQEQFARGFEAYLMEGKAPSADLRSAFEKFRAWLISIYQRLAGLNVNVSDDIRAVFDRMLASDAEIAQAQQESGSASPVFATAEQMGLTPDEYTAFLKLRDQSEEESKARLLREVMAPIKRERDKAFKKEKAEVREQVEREVNGYRYFRAIEWMANRRWIGDGQPSDMPDLRFSKSILVDRYGDGILKTLPRGKQAVYTAEGGLDPDDVAGWFGFGSGDEMIRAMERAPKRADAIDAETDKIMRERHGDALNDGEIEAIALDAVHTDKRGQWIAAELRAIVEVSGLDVGMTAKEARATARQTTARMRVRDAMNANRFLAAERKAAQEAAKLGAMLARDKVWVDAARRRIANKARAALRGDGSAEAVAGAIDAYNEKFETTTTTFNVDSQTRVSPKGREFTIPGGERTTTSLGHNDLITKFADAKRRQLLNHALYMEARNVADEVEKAERFVARLGKKSTRERIAGAGRRENVQIDYLAAIDEILEQYDFRRLSGAAEERRGALNDFVEAMKAAGRENELAIPDDVLRNAVRKPYKTVPVEELRGVIDSLKNLEHVATRWDKLIDAQKQRELDAVVDDISSAFDDNVKKRPPGRVNTRGESLRNAGRQFLDLVLNAGTILREIDGFADMGAAYRNIKAPIDEAMTRLIVRKEKAATDLEALYAVYTKDERRRMSVREHVPVLGYALSKWEKIAIALNTGNEGNRQRLIDKNVRGSLSEGQLAAVLATLDERDADFIQSVWDYVGSFRDDIAARERRTTGVEPAWVEATPVTIAGKALRGGYYPLKYDPRLSSLARDDAANDIAQSLQAGRFGKAQTRQGHLKERAQSSGRDIDLDMSVLHRHVNQVIYDLELSEPVANSWRVLQDSRIRQHFIDAGKQADFDALEIWLKDVAEGELRSADLVGRAARTMKSNFTAAKLAFNLSTVAVQVSGLAQSMVVVGKKDMAIGVAKAFANPLQSGAEIADKSAFMKTRQTTFNKDIYDFYSDPKTGPVASRWGEIKSDYIGPLAFWLMTKVQWHLVDVPTWLAGYHQGLRRYGSDEAKAIAHADDLLKRSQASGLFSDRSAVERGSVSRTARQNDVVRLFTALGSYMFAKFNVAYERSARAGRAIQEGGVSLQSAGEALSWTIDMAFLFTLEAVATAAIKGQLPKDDDDEDKDGWLKFLAKQTAFSVMGTLPGVRDVASPLQGFDGGGSYGAITKEVAAPLLQAQQGEVDAAFIKSIVSATGLAVGLPATQINRAIDARARQIAGEDVSPIEYLLGRRK